MYGLPKETHSYFVEAISERPHLKTFIIKRFLNFTKQIEKSKKVALKSLLNTIKYDTQSVTGNNLREIMLLVEKNDFSELVPEDASKIMYEDIPEEDSWRVSFLQELLEIRMGEYQVKGFTEGEISDLIQSICVN